MLGGGHSGSRDRVVMGMYQPGPMGAALTGERDVSTAPCRVSYQLKRGPTNHSRAPALASLTSPVTPQLALMLATAPTRP